MDNYITDFGIFEWDDKKERKNIRKHGISFKLALHVFKDPNYIVLYDSEHSELEDREIAVGVVGKINNLVSVVYTERHGNTTRIISAQEAKPELRRIYNEYNNM